MSAIAAAAIGGLALSGFQVYEGQKQKSQGEQLAKNNKFTPEVMPYSVKQATQLAQQNYSNGMPGMQYQKQAIDQNAAASFANASKAASSGGDLIDTANKLAYGKDIANQQLGLQAATYKSNALGGYEAALGNEAQWQDKLYQNNDLQPYLRTANQASALQGAGEINTFKGLDSGLSAIQTAGQDYNNNKYKNLLLGGNQTMGQSLGISDLAAATGLGINSSAMIPQSQYYKFGQ